jgi:hypothetical protein
MKKRRKNFANQIFLSIIVNDIQYIKPKNQISIIMRNRTLSALYVFSLLIFVSTSSVAQVAFTTANSRIEVGLNIGPMNFLGDVGGNRGKGSIGYKDNDIPVTNVVAGLSLSYYPSEWMGFRVAGNIGKLEGDDKYSTDKGGWERARYYRNLNFRSPLYEAYAGIEFYPTALISLSNGWGLPRFRPYLIGGVGAFKFNPQGSYTVAGSTTWVDLKPLRTEGQGFTQTNVPEYSLTSYTIPTGIGIKYDITERLTFGIEFIHRFTGTDYIDDISKNYINPALFDLNLSPSQAAIAKAMNNKSTFYPLIDPNNPGYTPYRPGRPRGGNTKNDGYFSSTFRLTWKIGDVYADWFKNKNSMRCPQYF